MKVIVDYRTDIQSLDELKKMGYTPILTKKINNVYEGINGHPDIQLHLKDNIAICTPEVYEYYSSQGLNVVIGTKNLMLEYPKDIPYNAAGYKNVLICKKKNTDINILKRYERIININQGYAKCNICFVTNNAVITSDKGIYDVLLKNNFDVLKIKSGFINLYKWNGFIGGATGLIKHNLLAFNGDLSTHPNSKDIIMFCKNYGVDTVNLNNGFLKDIGSIICEGINNSL